MIMAAIVGYFIVVPIYEILSGTVHLDPITMLGIGIIMAVILVKVFVRMGSFVTLGMLLMLGVLLIIVGIAIDAEGIMYTEGPIDDNVFASGQECMAARGPNNVVYQAYVTDDYGINISYTSDNGSSWNDSVVISDTWLEHTLVLLGGIVVLANNTTLVHFYSEGADNPYDSYLAIRWKWSGAWDIRTIYSSDVTGANVPKMAVNDTEIILLTYWINAALRIKTFNMSTLTVNPAESILPTIWISGNNQAHMYAISVNTTGKFIICAKDWTGSFYRYTFQDFEKDHVVIYFTMWAGVMVPEQQSFQITSDGYFVLGFSLNYLTNYGHYNAYQSTEWGALTYVKIRYNTVATDYRYSVGSIIDTSDRVTYYWANDTGGGGGVDITKATEDYDASEAEWNTAITAGVYDYGTNDDAWSSGGWYSCRYPIVDGYSVNVPITGWMGLHIQRDEKGDPDDYYSRLYWNATFQWYDWPTNGNGDNGGNGGNGGGGPYNPGGGGGGAPHVTFTYQDTNWGIKFTPVHPTIHQVVSYKWLFGDGSSSTRKCPTHWYRNPGEYIVTVEIKFSTGVISRKSQSITVNEFSDLQFLFHMIQRDEDRVYIKFGYYDVVFTELSLVVSGMLAFVAVAVSLNDRKKYSGRFKESTATVVLRMIGVLWVGIAIILLIWIRMGGL